MLLLALKFLVKAIAYQAHRRLVTAAIIILRDFFIQCKCYEKLIRRRFKTGEMKMKC